MPEGRLILHGPVRTLLPMRGAGSSTDEDRRRIEFRAGLAIAASATLMAVVPVAQLVVADERASWQLTAAAALAFLIAAVSTLGLTGWWIDSLRTW